MTSYGRAKSLWRWFVQRLETHFFECAVSTSWVWCNGGFANLPRRGPSYRKHSRDFTRCIRECKLFPSRDIDVASRNSAQLWLGSSYFVIGRSPAARKCFEEVIGSSSATSEQVEMAKSAIKRL